VVFGTLILYGQATKCSPSGNRTQHMAPPNYLVSSNGSYTVPVLLFNFHGRMLGYGASALYFPASISGSQTHLSASRIWDMGISLRRILCGDRCYCRVCPGPYVFTSWLNAQTAVSPTLWSKNCRTSTTTLTILDWSQSSSGSIFPCGLVFFP
jgi:hypothetical protein